MHVAFWSPAWPLVGHQNGIITYVDAMKRELEKRGHRVSIFTPTLDESAMQDGVFQVRQSRWNRLASRLMRHTSNTTAFDYAAHISSAILRVHRQAPIDVIEMEESFGWFSDVKNRTSLPVLVKLHGPAFASHVDGELVNAAERRRVEREGAALRAAHFIISPSESTLQETLQRYRIDPPEARVVVNPLQIEGEVPIWSLDSCDRDAILFVGRFDLRKGGDVVLQAFARLLKDRPTLKLIFVGPDRGLLGPENARTSFKEYCAWLLPPAMRERVDYRGPLSTTEIERLRVKAMVTIAASRWENQAYALLEAMLQGCPIVSSDIAAMQESITHGSTGLLARCADPEDFAEKISTILDGPELAQRLGAAARQYVIKRHAPSTVVDTMLGIYQKVINMHSIAGS